MGVRRLGVALAALVLMGLVAGCGSSGGGQSSLSLNQLPLIHGASVVAQARQCDAGRNAFCAIQAVVVAPRAGSSGALLKREQNQLHDLGWTTSAGDDGNEVAADSPGHNVRVTYATALNDLIGLDEKWIKRPWPIWAGLDKTLYDRTPAMSIMLEVGPT